MCTLGDEYTVSIVRNHNIQLFVPAGRAWTVIFCSTAPRPPVGLLGTTGISTDFALSQYSLSISIFINHNVVLSSSTGQWTRLRYCWWGEIYPAAASKVQRRPKSYKDDRRQTLSHHLGEYQRIFSLGNQTKTQGLLWYIDITSVLTLHHRSTSNPRRACSLKAASNRRMQVTIIPAGR